LLNSVYYRKHIYLIRFDIIYDAILAFYNFSNLFSIEFRDNPAR
jgi:hypothetical protein